MKKSILVLVLVFLVLLSIGFWFSNSLPDFKTNDLLHFGIIILLVGLAVFVCVKRLGSAKRGEPAEDELSKKVLQKTAAFSYYISLYLWLFILYIKDRVSLDTEELIGGGILGMAIIFAICWVIINFRGVGNE